MWLLHTATAPNGPWILFFLDIAWYLLDFIFALFKLTYWFTCSFIRFPICFIFFHIFFSRKEDSFVCNRFRFLGRSKARKQHCIKSVRIRSYSGPHFPAFGPNPETYSVSLRIQSKCGKMRTRITPNTDTFHAVQKVQFSIWPSWQWQNKEKQCYDPIF